MHEIIYKGPFKDHIQNHIKLKQAIGYKYIEEAKHLKCFDTFTSEKHQNATTLTKEIVFAWCKRRPNEVQKNQCTRASRIRQFGKYLDSIGLKAYVIPKGYFSSGAQYMPHIYTVEELSKFFLETDKCHYSCECPHRHRIMPVIFRMIYMCGLRVSEARLLKVGDVDLKMGVLTINHSKNDNSRLVPMSDPLTKRCRNFSKKVHEHSAPEDYYFPEIENYLFPYYNMLFTV